MDNNRKKEGFLNVYNFIPFPEKKSKSYTDKDMHTGVIEYSITTETPLFIPNTSSEKTFKLEGKDIKSGHKSYDFYSYTELEGGKTYNDSYYNPVLPGSELRGMIRNIYETITGSCMSVLNSEIYPVKRVNETFQPGLLVHSQNGFSLMIAEDNVYPYASKNNKGIDIEKCKEGQKLYIQHKIEMGRGPNKVVQYSIKEEIEEENEIGYLIKGMKGPKKRNVHIFVPKNEKKVRDGLSKKEIEEKFNSVITSYQEQPPKEENENSYKEYKESLIEFLEGKGEEYFPVYYSIIRNKDNKAQLRFDNSSSSKEKELFYIAPACITKEISHHSIGELAGDMKPCQEERLCCPACDLFGMVGTSHETSSVSKIRFTDAYIETEGDCEEQEYKKYYEEITTLETLASPKLGNTDFYLMQPKGVKFWTYDYYINNNDNYICIEAGKLRGRKYYWHQYNVKLSKGIEKTELNKTVRPVKKGVTFKGKVFYDGVSQKQLNQLLWILNNGNHTKEEEGLAYKLGGGKPLGLGSVTLQVERIIERNISLEENHLCYKENEILKEEIKIPSYLEAGFLPEFKKVFFKMSSLHAADGMKITYPRTEAQKEGRMKEGYLWFAENHKTDKMRMRRTEMRIRCPLPIAEDMCTLPYFPKKLEEEKMKGKQKNSPYQKR